MYRFGRFEECLYYQMSVSSVCIIRYTEQRLFIFSIDLDMLPVRLA